MVRVDLLSEEYEKAVEAHKNKAAIHLTGELRRDGQRWRLYNPRELRIIPGSGDIEDAADDSK